MNLPFPTEDEFRAEAERRYDACYAHYYIDPVKPFDNLSNIDRIKREGLERTMDHYRQVAAALDGPRDKPRSTAQWAMYRLWVDPIATVYVHPALMAEELFEMAYRAGRHDERKEIRAAISKESHSQQPTVTALIAEQALEDSSE